MAITDRDVNMIEGFALSIRDNPSKDNSYLDDEVIGAVVDLAAAHNEILALIAEYRSRRDAPMT